jgi:hypothetical protein
MMRGNYNPDAIQDASLTAVEYMLDPSIPPSQRKYFERFYVLFTNIMALGNIQRKEIFAIILAFDEITLLMEMGLYDEARQIMGRELMKMQVSRSVDGFQTLFGQHGIQRTEHIEKVLARTKRKKGMISKITGGFGKKKQSEYTEEEI